MKIAFLIINWNAGDFLKKCIESIIKNCSLEKEIWVVDNNSNDNSLQLIDNISSDLHIMRNNENLGFSKANNKALKQINTEFCVFLNPDTLVLSGSIETLISCIQKYPGAAIVAPLLINFDNTIQESYGRFPSFSVEIARFLALNKVIRNIKQKVVKPKPPFPVKVDWVFGACFLGRVHPIRALGGFDDTYFMYSEDLELCYRLYKNKWEVWFHPGCSIMHYSSLSADKKWSQIDKYYAKYDGYYKFLYSSKGKFRTNLLTLIIIMDLIKKYLLNYHSDAAYHLYYRNAIKYHLKRL